MVDSCYCCQYYRWIYLANPPATSYNGVNLATSAASHSLPTCSIYNSQITIQPALAEEYILNNRAKNVVIELF